MARFEATAARDQAGDPPAGTATAQPAVVEPAVVEPATAQPAVVEPAGVEPATAAPAVVDATIAEPAAADASIADVAAAEEDSAAALEAQPAAQHDSFGGSGGFAFRLVVAPAPGRLRHLPPSAFHDGHEWVDRGQVLAFVEQGSTAVEVRSPVEGRLAGVLVRDGEPVLRGQPLVWLDEGRPSGPDRAGREREAG
jgi:biotin carboxyl carrier protein